MQNVLVFPCGSEIGLEIHRSLVGSKHFNVFGASSTNDHGQFVFENYISGVPFVDQPGFLENIIEIVDRFEINVIIPAHDSAVLFFSDNRDKIKATILTSDIETCRVCRSKKETYRVFENLIPTPKLFDGIGPMSFPVFLKPDVGQGSKGTHFVADQKDLDFYLRKDGSLLVLEFLPGKEYTIDCFTDRHGQLLFSEGRERVRISNGISVRTKPAFHPDFKSMAEALNRKLRFQGAWFYQVKERENGELVLMEVAPRIAGSMALFRILGVNFVQLSLFDRMGLDVSILYNKINTVSDRALTSRYSFDFEYDTIYIDFDDTIVMADRVNTDAIKLLYQARNKGIEIVLITRHKDNLHDTLARFSISPTLFNKIYHLKKGEKKSSFIFTKSAIFIDDSHAERKEVFDNLRIPVFGLDSLEMICEN